MNGKSSLDCKHKHMMKYGAPPDKFGVLCRLLTIEFHCIDSRIDFTYYQPYVPGNISDFVKMVLVTLNYKFSQQFALFFPFQYN